MALATKCPFCQTTFRVAQDQLKLRGGLVRCGNCREVFNGNDYLVAPEVAQQLVAAPAPQTAPQTSVAAAPAAAAVPAMPAAPAWPPLPNATASTTATSTRPTAPGTSAATTTPARVTPPNLSATFASIAAETSDAPWGDGADKRADSAPATVAKPVPATPAAAEAGTIKTLTQELSMPIPRTLSAPEQNDSVRPANTIAPEKVLPDLTTDTNAPVGLLKQAARVENDPAPAEVGDTQGTTGFPATPAQQEKVETQESSATTTRTSEEPTETSEDEDTPGFVQRAEQRERRGRIFSVVMAIGVALLSISLLLQALYLGRNQIAAWLPSTRPLLSAVCARLHCTVGLPANIEQLSLESNELQQVPPSQNIYTLTVLLRNRSASAQTWPYLELTLNDTDEKPITRRVFTPREYLTSIPQVNAGFSSNSEQQVKLNFELSQPVASGYRVYLFYP